MEHVSFMTNNTLFSPFYMRFVESLHIKVGISLTLLTHDDEVMYFDMMNLPVFIFLFSKTIIESFCAKYKIETYDRNKNFKLCSRKIIIQFYMTIVDNFLIDKNFNRYTRSIITTSLIHYDVVLNFIILNLMEFFDFLRTIIESLFIDENKKSINSEKPININMINIIQYSALDSKSNTMNE